MKNDTFFKILFWLITAILTGFIVLISVNIIPLMLDDPDCPAFMPIFFGGMFFAIIAVYTAIAIFVYRDTGKRGMKKWMWVLIATYVPNFIGLIIYMIVRGNSTGKCIHCGKPINRDFEVCPYCAGKLNLTCSKCGNQIKSDWKACPYCRTEL